MQVNTEKKAVFITALGLPCTGKSSVMRELGTLCNFPVFLEPEEELWPAAVMEREECGYFTGLMWFRSTRVPLLYKAKQLQEAGQGVIVDSYYDKAVYHYLGKPGMEWLLSPNDPYFPMAQTISKLDWDSLPDATCIITFEIEYDDWVTLLKKRNRQLDQNPEFLKSFVTQKYFIEAAENLAKERNIKHINFKQQISAPLIIAQQLKSLLIEEGILQHEQQEVC